MIYLQQSFKRMSSRDVSSLKAGRRLFNPLEISSSIYAGPGVSNCISLLDYSQCGVSSGSTISYWPDMSGYNYYATQSTAAKCPTVSSTGIIFDSTNDCMVIPSIGLGDFTVFVRGKYTNSGSYNAFFEHGVDANSNNGFWFYGSTTPFKIYKSGSVTSVTSGSFWFNSTGTQTMALRYSSGEGVIKFYRNGVVCKTSASFSQTGTVSASFNIGSRNQSSVFCGLELRQLLIYNTALDTSDLSTVESWLASQP